MKDKFILNFMNPTGTGPIAILYYYKVVSDNPIKVAQLVAY